MRAIHFPVFTNGAVCSHGYIQIRDFHVPVRVGGIAVYPNDLLHGDVNGVTTIPREITAEVAGAGEEFAAAEQVMIAVMREPSPSIARLHEAAAEKDRLIATLRRRIQVKGLQ